MHDMKLALAGVALWATALCAMAQMPAGTPVLLAPVAGPLPPWAYLILPAGIKPPPDDGKPQRLPGSNVQQWIRVVETSTVPKTEIILGPMLGAVHNGGSEPIGQRVIEIAEDLERVELRDSRAGFVAYVPPGSIARGEALVSSGGGRTIQCDICHGKDLKGLGDVPSLVGRSPTYVVRQLYDIQSGARNGPGAQLMKAVVEKLTLEDMIALAAYTASRAP